MASKVKDPKIYKALADIAAEIEAVSKSKQNKQQGFQYRSVDDIYNMISPLLGKHRVVTVPNMLERKSEPYNTSGGQIWNRVTIKMKYDVIAEDGSRLDPPIILETEGSDSGDKGTNKAMSMAHKYALIQLFHIPTQDLLDDADAQTAEAATAAQAGVQPMGTAAAPAQSAPPPAKPKLSASDAAAKMKAAAPPPFHKVQPAVAKPAGDQLEICDCGAPGQEHTKDGCLIKDCGCGAFELNCYMSVTDYETLNVNGHVPKQHLAKKMPTTIEGWSEALKQCKTKEELTAMFNVDVPANFRKGRLVEEYGKLFNAFKAPALKK